MLNRNFTVWIFIGFATLFSMSCGNEQSEPTTTALPNEASEIPAAADTKRIADADFFKVAVDAFSTRNVTGTFVLEHLDGEQHVHNPKRAETRHCPASTFKIPHTLIALESGLAADTSELYKWNGVERRFKSWNQDMSLRKAYKLSALWVYQEIAQEADDLEFYQDWLDKFDYGNQQTGDDLTNFWINDDLQITPLEQIEFLKKLYHQELPLSDRTYELTKSVMETLQFDNAKTYSKTGWAVLDDAQYTWYVGWVETEDGPWFFALNMDVSNGKEVRKRFGITNEILAKTLGLQVKQQQKKQQPKKPKIVQPQKSGS